MGVCYEPGPSTHLHLFAVPVWSPRKHQKLVPISGSGLLCLGEIFSGYQLLKVECQSVLHGAHHLNGFESGFTCCNILDDVVKLFSKVLYLLLERDTQLQNTY